VKVENGEVVGTQLELAGFGGADRNTIAAYTRSGIIAALRRGHGSRGHAYAFGAVVRALMAHHAAKADERVESARGVGKLDQAKARKLHAEASIAELRAGERHEELLPRATVLQAWSHVITASRTKLLALPAAIASQLEVFPLEWDPQEDVMRPHPERGNRHGGSLDQSAIPVEGEGTAGRARVRGGQRRQTCGRAVRAGSQDHPGLAHPSWRGRGGRLGAARSRTAAPSDPRPRRGLDRPRPLGVPVGGVSHPYLAHARPSD